jgi:hypothetical protein
MLTKVEALKLRKIEVKLTEQATEKVSAARAGIRSTPGAARLLQLCGEGLQSARPLLTVPWRFAAPKS